MKLNKTEKRRSFLISFAYFALFIALYYVFIKYAFWMLFPFIVAFFVAMILQKPIRFITKKTPLGPKLVSTVLVLLVLVAIGTLITLVGYALVTEFIDFFNYIRERLSSGPELIERLRNWIDGALIHLPSSISNYLRNTIDGMTASILNLAEESDEAAAAAAKSSSSFDFSVLATPINGLLSTARRVPVLLVGTLVAIISCVFMTSGYSELTGLIKGSLSEEHEKTLVRTKHIIFDVLGKWVKSYSIILFITFCELSLGLSILKWAGIYKGGYIAVIAVCTALLDIFPVFGTGTVLIPWAVISLLTHKPLMFIGLIIIYVIIFVVRQIIEPKILSSNIDMNPVITLMSMYLGTQMFGVLGIFILPITVVIIKTLNDEGVLHLWQNRYKPQKKVKSKKKAAAAVAAPAENKAEEEQPQAEDSQNC